MTRRAFLLTVLAAAAVGPPKRSALLDARDLAKIRRHAANYGMSQITMHKPHVGRVSFLHPNLP